MFVREMTEAEINTINSLIPTAGINAEKMVDAIPDSELKHLTNYDINKEEKPVKCKAMLREMWKSIFYHKEMNRMAINAGLRVDF